MVVTSNECLHILKTRDGRNTTGFQHDAKDMFMKRFVNMNISREVFCVPMSWTCPTRTARLFWRTIKGGIPVGALTPTVGVGSATAKPFRLSVQGCRGVSRGYPGERTTTHSIP